MNKRIKKKHAQQARINILESHLDYALHEINILHKRLDDFEKVASINTKATNARFDQLEAENKSMRVDLDEAVITFKAKKKSWFGRK